MEQINSPLPPPPPALLPPADIENNIYVEPAPAPARPPASDFTFDYILPVFACSAASFIVSIFIGLWGYIIFTIVVLASTPRERLLQECPNTQLQEYTIFFILALFGEFIFFREFVSQPGEISYIKEFCVYGSCLYPFLVYKFLLFTVSIVWGVCELFIFDCAYHHLSHLVIYKLALTYWICSCFMFFIFYPIFMVHMYMERKWCRRDENVMVIQNMQRIRNLP